MRLAVAFLTRLSVGGGAFSAAAFSRAAWWFPVVGLLVGGVVGGVRLLGDEVGLDPSVATLLALLAGVLLTGGLHEDGLADVADAAGAHVSRERRLEILKDSRVGTFGGLALVFAVALAWAALRELDGSDVLVAALSAHVLARWAILPVALLVPPATSGSGALLSPSVAAVAATGVLSAAAAVAAGAWPAVPATLVVLAACLLAWPRVFGGSTGDTLGATAKLVDLGVLVTLSASL